MRVDGLHAIDQSSKRFAGLSFRIACQPGNDEIILARVFFPEPMKRHVLLLGVIGGVLIAALQWAQYRFLVIDHSFEIYAGFIAAAFSALGIWIGLKLTRREPRVVVKEVPVPRLPQPLVPDPKKLDDLSITPRELEILALIAQGMSNREIAEKLYVSENTVKTHSSRVFDKLGAKRRTQAVQLGKEFGLLR